MRTALIACALLLSCGDDSAPPGNVPEAGGIDAPADGSGGAGGGTGGSGGMTGDGGEIDGPYMPICGNPPCPARDPNSICVDPDGPGGVDPFCGCANDTFCQMTGHCELSGPNIGRCRCGNGLPCAMGTTICVNNACENIHDAGP